MGDEKISEFMNIQHTTTISGLVNFNFSELIRYLVYLSKVRHLMVTKVRKMSRFLISKGHNVNKNNEESHTLG